MRIGNTPGHRGFVEIQKIVKENEEEIKARKIQPLEGDLYDFTVIDKINEIVDYINKRDKDI